MPTLPFCSTYFQDQRLKWCVFQLHESPVRLLLPTIYHSIKKNYSILCTHVYVTLHVSALVRPSISVSVRPSIHWYLSRLLVSTVPTYLYLTRESCILPRFSRFSKFSIFSRFGRFSRSSRFSRFSRFS